MPQTLPWTPLAGCAGNLSARLGPVGEETCNSGYEFPSQLSLPALTLAAAPSSSRAEVV